MSWTLNVEGTVDEIRSEVHRHEVEYWRHMPVTERLAVHHLIGHVIEEAEEYTRDHPDQRFLLTGNGDQGYGTFSAHVNLYQFPVSTPAT
jgi:hypothetical protein